jgi:hypothetical protein
MNAPQIIREAIAKVRPWAYTGKLRVGSVYRSRTCPDVARRITRMQYDCVYYVLHQENKRPVPDCAATESMFRDFTSHEIKPEDL